MTRQSRPDEVSSFDPVRDKHRISFQNGPVMAQATYAEFLTFIADRMEFVHGESPNVDYMLRLRELAASVVPADADRPSA